MHRSPQEASLDRRTERGNLYIGIDICIYIYIERERERSRERYR